MRVARVIAALGLLASLAGCVYGPPLAYTPEMIAPPPASVPLTRCGHCEADVAKLPPAPYSDP